MKQIFRNHVIKRLTKYNLANTLLIILLLSSFQAEAGNSWSSKKSFGGGGRVSGAGFMIGNNAYFGTGLYDGYVTAGSGATSDFWEWNGSTNSWTQKADYGGGARIYSVGFSIGNKGYIGTGEDEHATSQNDFWQYDPSQNTWTQKTKYPGGAVKEAAGFSLAGKGYIGTGLGTSSVKSDFYEYDTSSDSWSQMANFGGSARSGAVGFSIGTIGYIGTGLNSSSHLSDFWQYDPSSDKWTKKADFSGAGRLFAVGFSIGSKGYLGTGLTASASAGTSDFYEYDPSTNTWTKKTSYDDVTYGAVGFSNCTNGYIGTGVSYYNSPYNYSDFAEYTPTIPPEAAFTASKTELCPGGSVNFTDSSTNGPISWTWTFQGGSPGTSTSQNPSNIEFKNSGSYTVTLVASNKTCSSTASKTITVDSLPTIATNPTAPKLCAGSSVSITASGATTYSWSPGTGLNSMTKATVTANPSITTDYTITGASSVGCINTTKITVTVNPKPSVSFSLPSSICLGSSAIPLSGTPSGGTFSGTGISGNTFASSQAGTGSFNITYSYTDNNGCSNSAQNTITVNPLPKADAGHDVTICGGSTNLLASGGSSYSWSPGTGLSCTNCPDPIASPTDTTKYTVTVTGTNGCSKDASVTVIIATSITANAGSDSAMCKGKSTILNASGGTGYSWHPTSGLTNPNIYDPVASPDTTTTYIVKVTSGTCTPDSDKVTITVNPLPPIPTITANGTTLKSSYASGNQWYMNGNIIAGATLQFYTITQNAFYSVCVINANGCSSCSQDTSTTGINESTIQGNIDIFPNPTTGNFILDASRYNQKNEIVIFNILGEIVYIETLKNERIEIDLSSKPKGTYFLELRNESVIFNKKLIME